MDEKDFKQAMKWYRRAPVTHVAPESGSLAAPQKKDITQREKARVWFPRPAACSRGVKPGDSPGEKEKPESAAGALALYRDRQVAMRGVTEEGAQAESMNAPAVPLADTMTEDNPPLDVDYTVLGPEGLLLPSGVPDGEAAAGSGDDAAADPFAGMIASVETGLSGILAEKPPVGAMPLAGGGDDEDAEDEDEEADDAAAEEVTGGEERAGTAGSASSLPKADEKAAAAAAAEVLAALSEEELAEIAGFDPVLLLDDGELASGDAPVTAADDAADGKPQEAAPEESAFEAVAGAVLMDALIADEAAAQAEAFAGGDEAESPDAPHARTEVALSEETAFEDAAGTVLTDAPLADEATAQEGVAEEMLPLDAAAETGDAGGAFAVMAEAGAPGGKADAEDAVPGAEPEGLSGAEAGMTAAAGEDETALSAEAEAGGEDFDAALAGEIPAEVMAEAEEGQLSDEAAASGVEAELPEAGDVFPEEAVSEETAVENTPGAAGFDAADAAEGETGVGNAAPGALPDAEQEIPAGAEAAVAVEAMDGDAALSAEAVAGEEDFDESLAEDILAEVMPEATEGAFPDEAPVSAALAAGFGAAAAVGEEAGPDQVMQAAEEAVAPAASIGEDIVLSAPDPATALADAIRMAEGDTVPDFEVPPLPVLDEMMAGPEAAMPEEQVFRDKIEAHQRNRMAFAEYKVAAAYALEDTPASRREAVKWYTRAAENGHAVSQFNLGNIYYAGRGVAQDYTLAADWYELAAGQGVARAQDNLGLMYFHGRGRPVEMEAAVYWFRQAAIQGYAPAQYKLATHLEAGVGTEPDLAEALHWYRKAASQGDAKAGKDAARLLGQQNA